MDLTSLIIGLVFLALFIGPIIWLHWLQAVKGKKLLRHFLTLAEQQQVKITESDLWNGYGIGIDAGSKRLFYLKQVNGKEETVLIDLSEVEKCRLVNKSRVVNTEGIKDKVIEKLDLAFSFYSGGPERTIEFYNGDENMFLSGEFLLAEKWVRIINSNLQRRKIAS